MTDKNLVLKQNIGTCLQDQTRWFMITQLQYLS